MFSNVKLIGVIVLSMLLLVNCKKENKQDTTSPGELVFAPMDAGNEKDGTFDVLCDESLNVTHARVVLNNTTYYPLTFELAGKLYTQSIKLAPGWYTINEFSLMDDNGTPNDYSDDAVVKATPMADSDYAQFVSNAIDDVADFEIFAFEKNEFAIDVLCYIPAEFDNFGFEWFQVNPITVREQCFFGDICIDNFALYMGSLYGPIVESDEVAIYKIRVYRDGNYINEFYNSTFGEDGLMFNSPLCIEYADYDMQDNEFNFELWVYAYDYIAQDFAYIHMYTWNFWDDETLVPPYNVQTGEDGVVEFVVGNCVSTPTDYLLPAWTDEN